MRCFSCQSIWHLLDKCPESYENLRRCCNTVLATFEDGINEESYITNDLNESMMEAELENVALFKGEGREGGTATTPV